MSQMKLPMKPKNRPEDEYLRLAENILRTRTDGRKTNKTNRKYRELPFKK